MAPTGNGVAVKQEGVAPKDDRGLRFGTGVAYDDAYAGGEDSEYVTSLPTLDEENKMLRDDSHVRAKEDMEDLDEGRVSSHPSTLAAKGQVNTTSCPVFTKSEHIHILTNAFVCCFF
jgi:hypothetical protein